MNKVETIKIKDTLPETLHELLKVALDDLESISEKEEYKVNMREWHEGGWDSFKCAVCLAGSVMARLIDYDSKTDLEPWNFKNSLREKFCAIDQLRTFDLKGAFSWLYTEMECRKIYPPRIIELVYGKTITKELENIEESLSLKNDETAFENITKFTNFKESMKFYRKLQTKLKALGV